MHDEDDLLADAFNDFVTDADRSLRVAQPGAIRGAALRRRRLRTVTTTLVATLLVGVPVAAYAVLSNKSANPPNPPAASGDPVPSREPSKPPSPSPTPSTPD